MWNQVYNPFNNSALSTIFAALPVVTLLVLIASNKVKAHIAAIIALIVANLLAIFVFTMPAGMSLRASVLGAVTGFFPIGWIVLNVIFLYRLTVEKGVFETLQTTIGGVTTDRRLQLLLIAFAFGAFFEGASGFGTSGGGDRRHPHRPWLLAACRVRPFAHRQHRARRLSGPSALRLPASPASPGSTRSCWEPWWDGNSRSSLSSCRSG